MIATGTKIKLSETLITIPNTDFLGKIVKIETNEHTGHKTIVYKTGGRIYWAGIGRQKYAPSEYAVIVADAHNVVLQSIVEFPARVAVNP